MAIFCMGITMNLKYIRFYFMIISIFLTESYTVGRIKYLELIMMRVALN